MLGGEVARKTGLVQRLPNADTFRERIVDLVDDAKIRPKWVVVAAEPVTDIDTTAAEMLEELDKELATRGCELAFAELKDPVKDRLKRYGLHKRIGREFFFPTIGVAVRAFLERHPVEWSDWEDEAESGRVGGEHAAPDDSRTSLGDGVVKPYPQ